MIYGNKINIGHLGYTSILEAGNDLLCFIEEKYIYDDNFLLEDFSLMESVDFKEKFNKIKEKISEWLKKIIEWFKKMALKVKSFLVKIKESIFGESLEKQHMNAQKNFEKWMDDLEKEKYHKELNFNRYEEKGKGSIPSIDTEIDEVRLPIIDKHGLYYYIDSFDFDHESFYKNYVNEKIFMNAYFLAEKIIMNDDDNNSSWYHHQNQDKNGNKLDYDPKYDREINGKNNEVMNSIKEIKIELRTRLFDGLVNCVRGDKIINSAINNLKGNKDVFIGRSFDEYKSTRFDGNGSEKLDFFETLEEHTKKLIKNKEYKTFDNLKDLSNENRKMCKVFDKASEFQDRFRKIEKTYNDYAKTFLDFKKQTDKLVNDMVNSFKNRNIYKDDEGKEHTKYYFFETPIAILHNLIIDISFIVSDVQNVLQIQSRFDTQIALFSYDMEKKYEKCLIIAMKKFVKNKLSEGYSFDECRKAIDDLF